MGAVGVERGLGAGLAAAGAVGLVAVAGCGRRLAGTTPGGGVAVGGARAVAGATVVAGGVSGLGAQPVSTGGLTTLGAGTGLRGGCTVRRRRIVCGGMGAGRTPGGWQLPGDPERALHADGGGRSPLSAAPAGAVLEPARRARGHPGQSADAGGAHAVGAAAAVGGVVRRTPARHQSLAQILADGRLGQLAQPAQCRGLDGRISCAHCRGVRHLPHVGCGAGVPAPAAAGVGRDRTPSAASGGPQAAGGACSRPSARATI